MSDRDPGHRSRRSARFEIRPTLGRTALFNLVLSGGLLPPPRRCARNEKKDKRSLVEKEIDTGACLIDAQSKGLASAGRVRELHVVRVHRFGKALGGLCNSCSLAGISMSTGNCPQACAGQRKCAKLAMPGRNDRGSSP